MACRLHAHTRLFDRRWPDDLALAAMDAAGVGSRGSAVRIHRAAFVGTVRENRSADDRIARRHKYSVLRRNGAADSLVAIQWLSNDFLHSVVHQYRRVWHRGGIRVAGANAAA